MLLLTVSLTRYSREFKLEALRLVALGERPNAQIARELGIRVNQLRKWRLEFEQEERTRAAKGLLLIDEDLEQLQLENAKRKEKNEVLKVYEVQRTCLPNKKQSVAKIEL